MADDFVMTAERMMQDARTLQGTGAHRNACYLAGYVVECTLKALLKTAGATPRKTHDVESLHAALTRLALAPGDTIGRYGDPSRLAPTMIHQVAPPSYKRDGTVDRYHCHWDPEHRYDGARWTSESTGRSYVSEAEESMKVLDRMRIDGVI